MRRTFAVVLAAAFLAGAKAAPVATPEAPMSLFDLSPKSLDGKPAPLSAYKGKVVLVVNVASECGYTPQYAGLEKLHEEYGKKGVAVLGFPSNDFGKQEPGSAEQIQKFCETNYGVKFPMFEKVVTKGGDASPVYKFLSANHGEPKWNFHKYLVGKDGQVKQAFPSKVEPMSKELLSAIDAELAAK
jgi:glutathione peroxidase